VWRPVLAASAALASLGCTVGAVQAAPPRAEAAVEAPVPVLAPVLSARRAPAALAGPLGERRLVEAVAEVADASPDGSCLVVSDGDRVLFERAADQPVVPASTLKLATGAAVLHHLASDDRLTTTVVAAAEPADGVVEGDLWLVGGGDPVLGTAEWAARAPRQPRVATPLEALADRVRESGVREVRGSLLGDESRYDTERHVATWPERYRTGLVSGPLSALSVNGGVASWSPLRVFSAPATDAAAVFNELLRQRGVAVLGEPGEGTAPDAAVPLAELRSPPLAELVAAMVRESDNRAAELLVKELGLRVHGEGSTSAGTRAVEEALAAEELPVDAVEVVDGSGLDPGNRLTCHLVHTLLLELEEGGPLDEGLPVAGRTGTLATRFLDTDVTGNLRAKTGSLRSVSALAGEATTRDGRELTFTFVANGLPADRDGFELQDALGVAMVDFPDVADLEELGPAGHGAGGGR
jgi:serine-type D-Ala-D-Ala carboxypeptidase/endopeptidase (penicillin-binding protein 4)